MEILKETRKRFLVMQIFAMLMAVVAMILLVLFPVLRLFAEALGCFALACILTVRMYYTRKIDAIERAIDTIDRTGAISIPIVSGSVLYGRFVRGGTGTLYFFGEAA